MLNLTPNPHHHCLPLSMNSNQLAYVKSMPFELLLIIFSYQSGKDIISFLSISRYYRDLVSNESIWRELCVRYDIHSLSPFTLHDPSRTFYTVYTELLHTFGPLIGLWSNDNPFRGNILEFRVVSDPRQVGWEGIVGEVWHFPVSEPGAEVTALPILPDYYECLHIELLPPDFDPTPSVEQPSERLTRFTWRWHHYLLDAGNLATGTSCTASIDDFIRLNAPHRQAFHLYEGPLRALDEPEVSQWAAMHPLFPPLLDVDLWHVEDCLPRLRMRRNKLIDHTKRFRPVGMPGDIAQLLYMAPSGLDMPSLPPSITLVPPSVPLPAQLYSRALAPPFNSRFTIDVRNTGRYLNWEDHSANSENAFVYNGHYFPLRLPFTTPANTPSVHAHSALQCLVGLWLGHYGSHGTEVMQIFWFEEWGELQAWKLTGDSHIPRGAMSWRLCKLVSIDELKASASSGMPTLHVDWSLIHVFEGEGTVSGEGYLPATRDIVPVTAVMGDENEFRLLWLFKDGPEEAWFRRYPGRDISAETVIREGARHSGVPWHGVLSDALN